MRIKILLDNTYLGSVDLDSFSTFNSLLEYGGLVASHHNKTGYVVDIYLNRDNKLDFSKLDLNMNINPYYHLFTDSYLYIHKEARILTEQRFDHVIKQSQYQSNLGVDTIFDLLYGPGINAIWGVIPLPEPWAQELLFLTELISDTGFQYLLSGIEIKTYRDFINAMKLVPHNIIGKPFDEDRIFNILANGEYDNIIGKPEYYYYMANYIWDSTTHDYLSKTYKTFQDYFRSMLTLEERIQNYIITTMPIDIRKAIRQYQLENMGVKKYMYDDFFSLA